MIKIPEEERESHICKVKKKSEKAPYKKRELDIQVLNATRTPIISIQKRSSSRHIIKKLPKIKYREF